MAVPDTAGHVTTSDVSSHDHEIFGPTRRDKLPSMGGDDDLEIGSFDSDSAQVADETVLQLRMQVRFRFFDDGRRVEDIRE